MLKPKQKKCIELMVCDGLNQKEAASVVNVSEKTVCLWKKNDEFIKAYDDAVKSSLRFAAAKAMRKQIKLIDSFNEQVAHLAAKDILDRGGYKADDKVELTAKLTPQILDDL